MLVPESHKIIISQWAEESGWGSCTNWQYDTSGGFAEIMALTADGPYITCHVINGRIFDIGGGRISSVRFPDLSLGHDVIRDASIHLWGATSGDVCDTFNLQGPLPPPEHMNALTDLVQPLIDRIAANWRIPIAEMFEIMEIPKESYEDALFFTLLGVTGWHMDIREQFEANVAKGENKLGASINTTPFTDAVSDLTSMIRNAVQAKLGSADNLTTSYDDTKVYQVIINTRSDEEINGTGNVIGYYDGQPVVKMLDGASKGLLFIALDDSILTDNF